MIHLNYILSLFSGCMDHKVVQPNIERIPLTEMSLLDWD